MTTLPDDLPGAIRAAAREQNMGLEKFRQHWGFPNGTFYYLLAGKPPRVVRTIEKLQKALGLA